jgi:tetratricopeptide (TPR) repeat protein
MNNWVFWAVLLFTVLTFYRVRRRRIATPKARVTAMLRRYRALEKSGLSEQEALLRLLATRADWKKLPMVFLAELVARFQNKEDLMRFVSVSEDSDYHRKQYPEFAKLKLEAAMTEIACLFSAFGFGLQTTGRYKEAEFVQRLALRLQPDQYFTTLPLAVTYHETGRHADALPLFESGLEKVLDGAKARMHEALAFPPSKCLAPDAELTELRRRYKKMYEACLKAIESKPLAGICLLGIVEILG